MLSSALDVGIQTVKKTGSVVVGLSKFKNSLMKKLKVKQLTAAQEKQFNDFFNKKALLFDKDVIKYAKTAIKEKDLNKESFITEMGKKDMFSEYDKADLEMLYKDVIPPKVRVQEFITEV